MSTPRRLSIPPPIPPTSPIPERTPPKTEPSSRMYSRSTTGDFTTASEESSRRADSFCSIERDDLPPKRPNDPLVRGMAAVGQGAGELIDRGLALIARSMSTDADAAATNGTVGGPEATSAGGYEFDSSLELSASPLPVDRGGEAGEQGGGPQGMTPPHQRYPSAPSHQKPLSSLSTASAPLAPNGHNISSHPRSSQVTSGASPSGFGEKKVERRPASGRVGGQERTRTVVEPVSGSVEDVYNGGRRAANDGVFPDNAPLAGWKQRALAREDSDQSFVTAPTSANDISNGSVVHFDLNGGGTATLTHQTARTYREMIAKQSSEESSDQEGDQAFTARRRDWSDYSVGAASATSESTTEGTKGERRLREALRTRTASQESSSGVSGSLDTETKLDDNRTLSRELIDDGTLHADGGRSSRSGRRSAASATSDAMHDSGMFGASFTQGDSHRSADHPDTVSPHHDQEQDGGAKLSSPPSTLPRVSSPDSHGSKIPILASSKMKRENSPVDTDSATANQPAQAHHVGFRPVYDDDENSYYKAKSAANEAEVRPGVQDKVSPNNQDKMSPNNQEKLSSNNQDKLPPNKQGKTTTTELKYTLFLHD